MTPPKKNTAEGEKPQKKVPKRINRNKDPYGPLNPRTAYSFYVTEKVKEYQEQKGSEEDNEAKKYKTFMREQGKAWKSMEEKAKQKYVQLYEDDVKRFQKQLKQYEETGHFEGQEELFVFEKEESKKKNMKQKSKKQNKRMC